MGKESKRTEGKLSVDKMYPEKFILNDKKAIIIDCGLRKQLEGKANVEFIVKAWNNHDGLVEALESIAKYLHTQDSIEAECALMEAMTVLNKVEEKE